MVELVAKYQRYAEYKDSGVEWLGEIPSEWELWKLSHAYSEIGSGTTPPTDNEKWFDGEIPWVTTGELRESTILGTKKKISKKTIDQFPTLRKYPVGSIAIAMYGATIGRLGIFGVEATTNQACCVMTLSKVIDNKYLFYWLQAFKNEIVQLSSGGGQPNINQEKVSALKVSAPKLNQQTQIAHFLDHETAKIDSLIEKQEKLIELLKEKRQAVISHAVTKGLNPDVAMKDSGVEWLGQVPEHWKICSLSKIFAIKAGGDVQISLFSEIQTDEHKFPIYTNANNANSIYGYSKIANYSANSITVSGRGDVGFAVYRDHAFDAIIRLLVLTPQKTCYTKYYAYFINEVIDFKVESSAIGQLSTLQISPYNILFPPFEEQKLITEYLDNETIKIDTLIHKAESVIQLMQERRTALISAAVTGKIDVRNWQNPTEAKMEFSA